MSLKKRLARGDLIISTMVSEVRTPNLARMLATAGLDSMIIDMEHGMFDWPEMAATVSVARGTGIEPVVRIPEIRRETVLKPLDAGASGLLVPMVNSIEQAEEVIRLAKYPPAGVRGTALRRGHSDYRPVRAGEYLPAANEQVALLLQVETPESADLIEKFVQLDGVDALFIGPFDLSVNMGIPGEIWHPEVRAVVSRAIEAGRRSGVATAIQIFDIEQAKELVREGVRYLSFSSDVNMIVDQAAVAAGLIRTGLDGQRPA
jgi:4-hydroxy-2-oxoheptanedioate aldolase